MTTATAANYDIYMMRGNTTPLAFRLKAGGVPIDVTDVSFTLAIVWATGAIRKFSNDSGLAIDIALAEVKWTPTLAESRMALESDECVYELEARYPGVSQRTFLRGKMIWIGGEADD